MAGSWNHMTNADGAPKLPRLDALLENGGDVMEALSQCYGMIWQMAHWLAPVEGSREDLLIVIERARKTWKAGYERGAGQSPW